MTRQEIEAAFLLAGVTLYAAVPKQNPYPGMHKWRGPIWDCHTPLGLLVVGYRKRVISIDWAQIGEFNAMIEPQPQGGYTRWLHADDVDQGKTYIHSYSLPNVARYLQIFAEEVKTVRFTAQE